MELRRLPWPASRFADVVFVSRGQFQRDWQGTLDHYVLDFGGDPARRGRLHFFDIRVEILSSDAAQLISRYTLTGGGQPQDGINTRLMRMRCPSAAALGTAILENHRFMITADGYASVVPLRGSVVHGVLWRLTARDLAALNAYESINSGLYRVRVLPVAPPQGTCRPLFMWRAAARSGGQGPAISTLLSPAHENGSCPMTTLRTWSAGRRRH